MERLHCHLRAREASDDKYLTLLADEVFRPLAAAAGHPERYAAGQFLDLLERAEVFVACAGEPNAPGQPGAEGAPVEAGEVVGFAALEDDGKALTVRCLCVAPAYEARGVAHQLLDWIEGLAYGRGRSRLLAPLPAADERSRRLFRSHAFELAPAASIPQTAAQPAATAEAGAESPTSAPELVASGRHASATPPSIVILQKRLAEPP